MKKIKEFILPEHANRLYKQEAASSFALTEAVAKKINELVSAYNVLLEGNIAKEQEQDGRISKAVLFMKDNLINSIHELFETLKLSGTLSEIATTAILDIKSRIDDTVSVLEFDAVGNGIADDSIALQKALNSGKIVDLNGRTFYHSQPIDALNVKGVMNGTIKGNSISFNNKDLILYNVTFDSMERFNGVTVWNDRASIVNCTFKNAKYKESVVYGLNLRGCKDAKITGCVFDNITNTDANAPRAIRLDDTTNVNIDKCVFMNMSGVDDGDYIHVYSLDKPTYTTIGNSIFYVNNCKSAIKVQSSDVYILNNRFICSAESERIYSLVRVQNGERHIIKNNLFFATQKTETAFPNILLLLEYCKNVDVINNNFVHDIASGYNANTGANLVKIIETENVLLENNRFSWNLMYRAIYLKQQKGKSPVIRCNNFSGTGCCVVFEESDGSFTFEKNNVELGTNGAYLAPIYSNGSATLIDNDITFNENSAVIVTDNLVMRGNILRNTTSNTIVDVISIASGEGFLRDNTYTGNIRYQIKGNPSKLTAEAIADQPTGTPFNITTMANVNYLPSRFKCNTLDFGYYDPTFTPRPMQEFYSTQKKALLLYVDGAWVSFASAAV